MDIPALSAAAIREDQWAIAPYHLKALPNDRCLVIRDDTGFIGVIDVWLAPLLDYLRVFRPLNQHLRHLLASKPNLLVRKDEIERTITALCRQSILVSGKRLLQSLSNAAPEGSTRLTPPVVAITTSDRPDNLERLFLSLAYNQQAHGVHWQYVIVDDSKQPPNWELNKKLASRYSGLMNVEYHGPDERMAFLGRISQELPDDAANLLWLLQGNDDASTPRITYGGPKNYLLLRYAGSRLILLDDDALLIPWVRSDVQVGFRFGPINSTRLVSKDCESLISALIPLGDDPIARHASVLGLGLNECFGISATKPSLEELLGQAQVPHLPRVDPRGCRIRVTMNGVVGDPGTADDLPFLCQDLACTSAASQEDGYQAVRSSPRAVFASQPWPLLTNQGYFQLATMAGIDVSEYFPPLMPMDRGEDSMIGFLMQILYPGDLSLILPWALEHRPSSPRPWRINAGQLPDQITPAMAFCCWAASCAAGISCADPRTKMTLLADHFLYLAGSNAGANRLAGELDAAIKMNWAQRYSELANAFTSKGLCPSLRADIDKALLDLQGLLIRPRVVDTQTLVYLIESNRRYFSATPSWMRAQGLIMKGWSQDRP